MREEERTKAAETAVRDNEIVSKALGEKAESLREDLDRVRCTEVTIKAERDAAQERVAAMEREIRETEREHQRFRDRTEGRLESFRIAFEGEEREREEQVCESIR